MAADTSTMLVREFGDSNGVHRTVIEFVNHAIALADNAGVVAYGSQKVLDLPARRVLFQGAVQDLALTKSSAGVNADWDGDVGLGTAAAGNSATLTSTEQNLIPTTATPQAVSGATTADAESTTTEQGALLAASSDVYLNFLVDDADHNVTGTACNLIVNGKLCILWTEFPDLT
jgi:hypothetical protein